MITHRSVLPLQVCIIASCIIPTHDDQMKSLGLLSLRKGEIVIIWVVKTSAIYWNTWVLWMWNLSLCKL